jgi:hypothetical protein
MEAGRCRRLSPTRYTDRAVAREPLERSASSGLWGPPAGNRREIEVTCSPAGARLGLTEAQALGDNLPAGRHGAMATSDGRCCCGRPYLPNGGGESDHYCHTGQRNICQECVTADKWNCLTHGNPTKQP